MRSYFVNNPPKGKFFWMKGYPIILLDERKYIIPFDALENPKRGAFIKIVQDCMLIDYDSYMEHLSATKERWVAELSELYVGREVAEKLFTHRGLLQAKDWANLHYFDAQTLSRWANARSYHHHWDCPVKNYHWKLVAKAARIMCYTLYGRVLPVPGMKEWEYWAVKAGAGVVRN